MNNNIRLEKNKLNLAFNINLYLKGELVNLIENKNRISFVQIHDKTIKKYNLNRDQIPFSNFRKELIKILKEIKIKNTLLKEDFLDKIIDVNKDFIVFDNINANFYDV